MSFGAVASVAGAAIGALGSKKSSGGTETAKKEPWEAAQPWLKYNLAKGQELQDYYGQNPFNAQQQQAYANLFGDLDNFRTNVAPGLFTFANSAMSNAYQRQPLARPGLGGYGAPGGVPAGGLLQQQQPAPQTFGMPQAGGNYGLLDLSPKAAPQLAAQPDPATMQQLIQEEFERRRKAEMEAAMWGGNGIVGDR